MNFWLRAASLVIAGHSYNLEDFRCTFDIQTADRPAVGTGAIKIYNLNETSRNNIKKGDTLIMNAGYKGDIGCIHIGEVQEFEHKKTALDWETTIKSVDSMNAWMGASINKTYKGPIQASAVMDDLLGLFGIEVNTKSLVIDKSYARQKICQGKIKDELRQIVVTDCCSRLLLRNGQIIINDPRAGVNNGYLLSPETGLLKVEDAKDQQSVDTDNRPEKEKQAEKEQASPSYKLTSLLNYNIACGDIIQVQSPKVNGNFFVIDAQFKGDTSSNTWHSIFNIRSA